MAIITTGDKILQHNTSRNVKLICSNLKSGEKRGRPGNDVRWMQGGCRKGGDRLQVRT